MSDQQLTQQPTLQQEQESDAKKTWSKPDFKRLKADETAGGPGLDDEGNASKLAS